MTLMDLDAENPTEKQTQQLEKLEVKHVKSMGQRHYWQYKNGPLRFTPGEAMSDWADGVRHHNDDKFDRDLAKVLANL
ncbi:MAG: hypothetical protein ACXADB_06045 [Candidatus Hermodarchaeia archaeon]